MRVPFLKWLTPLDLTRVSNLQLFAKGVVEGVSGGIHRSHLLGASIQFKEHRAYVPGDETKNIDWKLFGKTDRLYIRQYEDETNLRSVIALDQSGSMKYAGSRSKGLSKHEFAVRLAASLAYLLINQQDAVGLATFDSRIRTFIPPRSRPNHLQVLFQAMEDSKPSQETDLGSVLQGLLTQCRRRGLLFLISDCFGDVDSIVNSLGMLRSNQQEIVVFQIWDDDELDFPFQSRTMFRSLENEANQLLVDPIQLARTYKDNLARFQTDLLDGCSKQRIDLIPVRSSDSHSQILSSYLARRREVR